jgi:hypothetical protein
MKTSDKVRQKEGKDHVLLWTMRILGTALAGAALFLATKDIFSSGIALGFFGICAGLGSFTVISSFLPESRNATLNQPAVIHVPNRHTRPYEAAEES